MPANSAAAVGATAMCAIMPAANASRLRLLRSAGGLPNSAVLEHSKRVAPLALEGNKWSLIYPVCVSALGAIARIARVSWGQITFAPRATVEAA